MGWGACHRIHCGTVDRKYVPLFDVVLRIVSGLRAVPDKGVVCQGFFNWAMLSIPLRAQLSALVFEKTLRRKDAKGAGNLDENENGFDPEMTRQATINLVGVDAQRISDCVRYRDSVTLLNQSHAYQMNRDTYELAQAPAKVVVSVGFLLTILSWQGLLAGFGYVLF